MRRVFDCFTFFNELDLLEIRLTELDPLVDAFVLVEARQTHKGGPKPLWFAEAGDRFAPWAAKIRHVVLDDFGDLAKAAAIRPRRPPADANWAREWLQREAIARGLGDARPDDLVLVSDVDEIPSRAALSQLISEPMGRSDIVFLEQTLHVHWLDRRREGVAWRGTRAGPWRVMRSPQKARLAKPRPHREALPGIGRLAHRVRLRRDLGLWAVPRRLPGAGWHFTSLGGAANVTAKLDAFAHSEPTLPAAELVRERLDAGLTFLGDRLAPTPLDALPAAVRADPGRFAHLMANAAARAPAPSEELRP